VTREARLRVGAAAYLVVALLPLFVVLVGTEGPRRGFWVEFGVALGFIGLAMLGMQSVLTARFPSISGSLGQDALLQFHRQTGLVAFGLVLAHPVILLAAEGDYWEYLDPRDGFLRAVFLNLVLVALVAIVVTSLWRDRLRLPYEWWRLGHGALAVLVVLIGLVHIMQVRHYLDSGWKQALWTAIGVAAIGSVLYVRAVKPLRVKRHPYRVTAVEPLAAGIWRLALEPDQGEVLRFRAGQFAFLTIAESPFSLQQHPFSVASSARRTDHLEVAVKELGDFTRGIGRTPLGARAYVDGPYGSLHLPADPPGGLLLVAGGIGITPIMSMLRTLADDGSTVPTVLVYANRRAEDIAYAEELERLASLIRLEVVHVVAEPEPGWSGERGLVSAELLGRYLPGEAPQRWRCVLCGPPPMMEAVEQALVELGMPVGRIESERFDIGAAGMIGRRATGIRRMVLALGVVMVAAAALFAA
jgi:3-phenylpropionate/trans-cinnamate dioxygenase ferredoxin reductase subunit